MFGFFKSQEAKMRENAANWLELADKVYHFRRDVLSPAEVADLQSHTAVLRQQTRDRAGAEKLKLAIERLEEVLRRTGGAIYPKTALVENVEFFLVAALVILGIRTYFVQPFKIPTNSMWPTYNGMTPEVFHARSDEPNPISSAGRFALFGARPYRIDAPADGEILVPITGGPDFAYVPPVSRSVPGRTWLILPTTLKQFALRVGDSTVTLNVPQDFDFDWVIRDTFFPPTEPSHEPAHVDLARAAERAGALVRGSDGQVYLKTGKFVKRGERVLSFDIITGDQLFVDRFSYHFFRPSVGSGFVFRTGNIKYIADQHGDQYYIKRLVGVPGDTLEIKGFTLYRNGAPITGSVAFDKNAHQEGKYVGYRAIQRLAPGETVTVPPHRYFAMGDNSANSEDGRYWGFVPAKDVVGRPLFVYYPFTSHWGPAR